MAYVNGNPAKPMRMGPIAGTNGSAPYKLHIPLTLQGEWVDEEEGHDLLFSTAADIGNRIERLMIDRGEYVPYSGEKGKDSPVMADISDDENMIIVRVNCKPEFAPILAAEVKRMPIRGIEMINPQIERDR